MDTDYPIRHLGTKSTENSVVDVYQIDGKTVIVATPSFHREGVAIAVIQD